MDVRSWNFQLIFKQASYEQKDVLHYGRQPDLARIHSPDYAVFLYSSPTEQNLIKSAETSLKLSRNLQINLSWLAIFEFRDIALTINTVQLLGSTEGMPSISI